MRSGESSGGTAAGPSARDRCGKRPNELVEARRLDRVREIVAVRPHESRQFERVASRGESVVVASSARYEHYFCAYFSFFKSSLHDIC